MIEKLEDVQVPENSQDIRNDEFSINYVSTRKWWNQWEIIVDNIFAYNLVLNIMHENEDLKPRTVKKCWRKNDCPKSKEALDAKLDSLAKCEIFGPVV